MKYKMLFLDENESSQEVSGNTLNNSSKGASKRRKMFQQSDPSNTILEEVVVEELVNPSKKRTKIRPSRIPRKTTSKLEQDVRGKQNFIHILGLSAQCTLHLRCRLFQSASANIF